MQLAGRRGRVLLEDVVIDPADAVRIADHQLKGAVGNARRLAERVEKGRRHLRQCKDRRRRPLRAGDVRGRLWRQRRRVNRHRPAAVLQRSRRRKSDDAAAQHGRARGRAIGDQIRGERGAAPRQAEASAAVSVIVHQHLRAERLRAKHESARAIGTQPDDRANNAPRVDVHRRETRGGSAGRRSGRAALRQERGDSQ